MIKVTLEFNSEADLLSFFSRGAGTASTVTGNAILGAQERQGPKVVRAVKPAADALTPEGAATQRSAGTAQSAAQPEAAAEVTPEMGSAIITKLIPTPEHKAAAAAVLAKHKVTGFKHLPTPEARAACYADLLAIAAKFGIQP